MKLRVTGAAREGAEAVAVRAKERAPVETGALRDAIHVEKDSKPFTYNVVAGVKEAFYGHMVEFGTSHSSAHPFLVPAAEESVGDVERIVTAALQRL
jgi:HK97 gp10 family phage protein